MVPLTTFLSGLLKKQANASCNIYFGNNGYCSLEVKEAAWLKNKLASLLLAQAA